MNFKLGERVVGSHSSGRVAPFSGIVESADASGYVITWDYDPQQVPRQFDASGWNTAPDGTPYADRSMTRWYLVPWSPELQLEVERGFALRMMARISQVMRHQARQHGGQSTAEARGEFAGAVADALRRFVEASGGSV